MRSNSRRGNGWLLIATAFLALVGPAWLRADDAPPNGPARVEVDRAAGRLVLHYHGDVILDAKVMVHRDDGPLRTLAQAGVVWAEGDADGKDAPTVRFRETGVGKGAKGKPVEQSLQFELEAADPDLTLVLRGTVSASDEAFAAETRGPAQERFPLVRNSVGPSSNLRNNAIYDRRFDWVLFGPTDGRTRIVPLPPQREQNRFELQASGRRITLVFRPRYYQKHRNLPFFEPWKYRVWQGSITGWCSWAAYGPGISEATVDELTSVFADKLLPYGVRYIQIDDGYQAAGGPLPEHFLKTNKRFPSGLAKLAEMIRSKGLEPGLWVHVNWRDPEVARRHPEWTIRNAAGQPAPWWPDRKNQTFFSLDGSNPQVIAAVVRPLYRELRRQEWSYIKIDGLRHLLYDGIYRQRAYFADKDVTGEEAFRRILETAREELGRNTYVLACWGTLPETIGIVDACRLGADGFGPQTLLQYNSLNNVVWRNDPDHCDIRGSGEEIIRPVLLCMAGSKMMLTDRAEVYRNEAKIEGVRRSSPIPFTLPGQLYDVDPVKTDNLKAGRRNDDGGNHSGPIDADQWGNFCPWWLLEIQRSFESWNLLARLDWKPQPEARVKFAELGLDPDKEYLVYEFWTKQLLGSFRKSFRVPAQEPREVRVWAIREKLDRPQIISTSRHVTQGGVELHDVRWDETAQALSGRSDLVGRDPYRLYIHLPETCQATDIKAEPDGVEVQMTTEGKLCIVTLTGDESVSAGWRVQFATRGS